MSCSLQIRKSCSSLTKYPELPEEAFDSDPDEPAFKAEPDDNLFEVQEACRFLVISV